jgi:hypothetical protein
VCGDRATTAKKVMGQQLVDAFAENLQRIRQQRSSVRGREGTRVCRVSCGACRVSLFTQLLLCAVFACADNRLVPKEKTVTPEPTNKTGWKKAELPVPPKKPAS